MSASVQEGGHAQADARPIVYVDIDDVLVAWPPGRGREAAPHAGSFLRWLLASGVEIRWLSSWCPSGTMTADRQADLAALLGVGPDELDGIENPMEFPSGPYPKKHVAIDWETSRPWVVVHDERWHKANLDALEAAGKLDCYVRVDTSLRPDDLWTAQRAIATAFRLPLGGGGPS